MRYVFIVSEKRAYDVRYTVEADSLEEARERAERGETVDEFAGEDDRFDVVGREIIEELGEPEEDECPVCGESGYSDPEECSFCQDQADYDPNGPEKHYTSADAEADAGSLGDESGDLDKVPDSVVFAEAEKRGMAPRVPDVVLSVVTDEKPLVTHRVKRQHGPTLYWGTQEACEEYLHAFYASNPETEHGEVYIEPV